MLTISVGTTASSRDIMITNAPQASNMAPLFATFSERDLFDALLGVEYLVLCAQRRNPDGHQWLQALYASRAYLNHRLSKETVDGWRRRLGIKSAFAARDYGRTLIHPHFRSL